MCICRQALKRQKLLPLRRKQKRTRGGGGRRKQQQLGGGEGAVSLELVDSWKRQPAAQPLAVGGMTWRTDIPIEKQWPDRLSEQSEQIQGGKKQPDISWGLLICTVPCEAIIQVIIHWAPLHAWQVEIRFSFRWQSSYPLGGCEAVDRAGC